MIKMIYKYRWLLLIIFFTGLLILLLPDKARPILRINEDHGPSVPDLTGLILMLISWLISVVFIAGALSELAKKFGKSVLLIMMILYFLSVAGVIAGLNLSSEWILWISVAVATIINSLFVVTAFKIAINKK